MANNVIAQVLGGKKNVLDGVATVADARSKLGLPAHYQGSVNMAPANDSDELVSGDYVSFSEAVKGA